MPTPQVNPDGTYPARALPNPTRRPLETRREAVGPLHTPATDAASVVHGLRNPLAGIRATVQIARERANDPELNALLSDALREADRLDARIRALLELSRPLAAQLGPVDLAALFEAVVEALGPRCSACGVKIEAHIDQGAAALWADADALEEILLELCENALRASQPGGAIRLLASRDNEGVQLRVTDRGIGIAPAIQRRIFEPFFTTRGDGTGLGLASVRSIAEQLGGRVALEHSRPERTTFRVTLPARA